MKTELLAPAGSYSKLETALHFGADAVYIGGKAFSLRTFADNFTEKELRSAVDSAHRYGKKIYVAANVFARNEDFDNLKDYFRFLKDIGTDAAIVSDPGVIYVAKESAPELPLHLSTQANTSLGSFPFPKFRRFGILSPIFNWRLSYTARCVYHIAADASCPTIWMEGPPIAVSVCSPVAGNTKSGP